MDIRISSRRIMAAYGRGRADRVPIASPISWSPARDIDRDRPGGWRGDPGFMRVARLVQEHCDVLPPHSGVDRPQVFAPISYNRFLEAPMEFVETLPPERLSPTRTGHTTLLHTPKGDLRWAYDADDGSETDWDRVKPINSPAGLVFRQQINLHRPPATR